MKTMERYSVLVGQKHPRDPLDDNNTARTRPSQNSTTDENNDVRSNAERPGQPASLNQNPTLSTTSNVDISFQKLSPSSMTFGPPRKDGVLHRLSSTRDPYSAESSKSGMQTGSLEALGTQTVSLLNPDVGRQKSRIPKRHALLATSSVSPEVGPSILRVSQEWTQHARSSTGQNQGQSKRMSTLEPSASADVHDDSLKAAPPTHSLGSSHGTNPLFTDSEDTSFVDQGDLANSTSRLYAWTFLDGEGRLDSDVISHWVYNEAQIVSEEYRPDGLQEVLNDDIWEALCDAVRDPVQRLPNEVVIEAHEWSHQMANNNMEKFEQKLEESPPKDRHLRSILSKLTSNSQYWNTQARNEDTYLKSVLGPFLDTYFGKLKYTNTYWTPTQDDTNDTDSSTLVPDYGVATLIGLQRYFVLLLEGKINGNDGRCQMWDDLTKLGNEMKSALDSILKLMPSDAVCVFGILVKGKQGDMCVYGWEIGSG
ncbi:hypothetical protein FBU30_003902 [Linnemannia zychae]|nr:hypothetical protein FBU30_003902 [Linnemannia zychae]